MTSTPTPPPTTETEQVPEQGEDETTLTADALAFSNRVYGFGDNDLAENFGDNISNDQPRNVY